MTFLMRNCFAHFREVNNGHQSFGINTKVSAGSGCTQTTADALIFRKGLWLKRVISGATPAQACRTK
jgi:hypothetical protein